MVYLGISNTSSPFAVMIFNEIPSISLPSVESITPSAKPPSFSRGTQHDRFGSYGWKVSNISYYKMKLLLNVTMCRNLRYNWLDYMLTSILVECTVPKHYKLRFIWCRAHGHSSATTIFFLCIQVVWQNTKKDKNFPGYIPRPIWICICPIKFETS